MVDITQMYPSKFFRATDVPASGLVLTIEKVYQEEVDSELGQKKWTVKFVGEPQLLVLNKTNGMTLAVAFGNETNSWLGKKVRLKTENVFFRGAMTPGIRVQAVKDSDQFVKAEFPDQVSDINM